MACSRGISIQCAPRFALVVQTACGRTGAGRTRREAGYREQVLKPYPWVCGRCAREFERRNLCELTVHHIDHDHGNNPRDGSNWELLCIYCHDEEHRKFENFVRYRSSTQSKAQAATYKPFAGLRAKMEGRI